MLNMREIAKAVLAIMTTGFTLMLFMFFMNIVQQNYVYMVNRNVKYILQKSDFQAINDVQDRHPGTFFELKQTNIKL